MYIEEHTILHLSFFLRDNITFNKKYINLINEFWYGISSLAPAPGREIGHV